MNTTVRPRRGAAGGFSLVELLVVIGLIAALCSLLLPALSRARQSALSLQCQDHLRSVGQALKMYEIANKGWFYPVVVRPGAHNPHGRGITWPPHERWPMFAFDMRGAPHPLPYDPAEYRGLYDRERFPVAPYTPAVLRCPTDPDPVEAHTYFINGIAAQRRAK